MTRSSRARARLLFALAHALDGKGEYARAAECLRESNALTLEPNPTVEIIRRPITSDSSTG